MDNQKTIKTAVSLDGVGLFMGQPVSVRFKPAPENHGIVFVRPDIKDGGQPVHIPAVVDNVTRRARRTAIRKGQASIETIEHCMSAVVGMGITNLLIEVTGPEMPGGDGSAALFVDALKEAGLEEQDQPKQVFEITEPVTIEEGDAMIAALPADTPGLQVIYNLDYGPNAPIPRQVHAYNSQTDDYLEAISSCRTFVLEAEARALQAKGLGSHLSPETLLVIGEDGPLGGNAYRFEDELVRHKILDLIGDIALLGVQIHGRIVAYRSGHAENHRLTRELRRKMMAKRRGDLLLSEGQINIRAIQRVLPHRYPMLLIDRVLEVEEAKRVLGVKNVTVNEPFFQGHYPGTPIMPGVLIVEAMAQLSGILLSTKLEHTGKLAVLLAMDKVKLRKPVTPGDQLVIEAETIRVRSRTGHTKCKAYVSDQLAAEAEIKFMLVDAEQD